ncbi:MAG TPA: hypothetical protein P5307_24055, partial [Pirellulaceae bacterium]|nr:hypothetical protein [Pirellulaceae bacterium]
VVVASGMFVVAWSIPEPVAQFSLAAGGGFTAILALAFRQLTIRDNGDALLICFGPLPLFRRSVLYADLERVEQGRSSWFDGWGIHISPSGGWTWNLWGFDCVDVYMSRGRKLRIGTDDPAELAAFLQQQISSTEK